MLDHDKRKALQELFTGSLASIVEMVAALEDEDGDQDEARETIEQDALSVEVRTGWHVPGQASKPDEYRILLTTGGPAVQIVGDLSEYGEPDTARLEVQDWFTQWETFATSSDDDDALMAYAQCFYFGD